MTLVDAAGTEHPAAGEDARIVSLVPSLTELLFELGLGGRVVGRTAYCTRPEGAVRKVRSVGGTKMVHMDRLAALDATHAVVNIDETPREIAEAIAAAGLRVVVTHPLTVADNVGLYRLLGGLFGRAEAAERLVQRLRAALRAVPELPPQRVLYLIWKDPWMTVSRDTYVSDMLATLGWRTVGGDAAARYPEVEIGQSLLAGTDLVLFPDEPFPFAESHLDAFAADYGCARDRLSRIDGAMVSWYGSRAIPALGYLADFRRGLKTEPDDRP